MKPLVATEKYFAVSQMLRIELAYDPVIPLKGISHKKWKQILKQKFTHKHTHILIAALLAIAQR